jgi:hypothetical protein
MNKQPVKCPECGSPMTRGYTTDDKNVPGGIFYVCEPCDERESRIADFSKHTEAKGRA